MTAPRAFNLLVAGQRLSELIRAKKHVVLSCCRAFHRILAMRDFSLPADAQIAEYSPACASEQAEGRRGAIVTVQQQREADFLLSFKRRRGQKVVDPDDLIASFASAELTRR